MLKITQYNKKWRIEVQETWEWDNLKEMEDSLKEILRIKAVYGQLTN